MADHRRAHTREDRQRFILLGLVGLLAGGLGGWGGYQLSELKEGAAWIVPGALLGAVAGLVIAWAYPSRAWRQVVLKEAQFSFLGTDFAFELDREQRRVAWKLFIEIMTRVATQSLQSGKGFPREALDSLYKLFETTRELLKGMNPSPAIQGKHRVEELALWMLNRDLRPFLSEWHPLLKGFEERTKTSPGLTWDREEAFHQALEGLRKRILEYAKAFGRLAEAERVEDFFADSTGRPHG